MKKIALRIVFLQVFNVVDVLMQFSPPSVVLAAKGGSRLVAKVRVHMGTRWTPSDLGTIGTTAV